MKKTTTFLAITFLLFSYLGIGQNADTLLSYMDNLMLAPSDKEATVKIILTDKAGNEKIREAVMMQKGSDKKLYRYVFPESQAGISTLSLPDGVMWLYLPAFGKPTKITLLAKSQAFTGTDFSYEDMENKPYAQRYTPSMLEIDGTDDYVVNLVPMSHKSKYSKIVLYLNRQHYYPNRMVYYDGRGKKYKVATYTYDKKGEYWYAKELLMKDIKKNHSTKIIMEEIKFDQSLSDDIFKVENLKQD